MVVSVLRAPGEEGGERRGGKVDQSFCGIDGDIAHVCKVEVGMTAFEFVYTARFPAGIIGDWTAPCCIGCHLRWYLVMSFCLPSECPTRLNRLFFIVWER